MATSDQVQQLYITYFGRPADPSGLAYWTADSETPLSVIADGFATTPEFTADIAGRTLDQIVNSFYVDLFGRNAEPAGLAFWVNQIQIGNTTIQQAGLEISNAALTPAALGNSDNVALVSKIAASNQWTATTAASTEATLAYTGEQGINAGVNYLLPVLTAATIPSEAATEAQIEALIQSNGSGAGNTLELSVFADVATDTGTVRLSGDGSIQETSAFRFTAGNQTVNGNTNTFSGAVGLADRLVDGFTTDQDVLNITGLTSGAAAEGPSTGAGQAIVTNIENVNLGFTSATGASGNFAGFTGVQTATFSGSVANGGNLGITMANTGATTFTSTLTGNNLSIFSLTTGNNAEAITTSDVADRIISADGNDTIVSNGGNDTINAGAGADLISSGSGDDSITAGTGNDTIDAATGANVLTDAGLGNDVINHSAVGSTITAAVVGTGTVTVNATQVGFTSNSAAGVNTTVDASDSTSSVRLNDGTGNDTLTGGTAGDVINNAAGGNDVVSGNAGNDTIVTGGGNDQILGGSGADGINAGAGSDTVFGGEGNDTIAGGIGIDVLTGDAGANTFFQVGSGLGASATAQVASNSSFTSGTTLTLGSGVDVITDFGADDFLDVATSGQISNAFGATNTGFASNSNYFLRGEFNAATGVFTVGADATTGADVLVAVSGMAANGQFGANTSLILLDDTNAAPVAAQFV